MDRKEEFKTLIDKAEFLEGTGKFEETIEVYDKILLKDHKCINAINGKGNVLCKLGKQNDALKLYDDVLKIDPKNEQTLYNKAFTFFELRNFEKSLVITLEILKLNPENLDALNLKGVTLVEFEKINDAIKCYDQALNLNPKAYLPLINKANALYGLKHYNNAIRVLNMAIKVEPKKPAGHYYRGLILQSIKNYQGALKSINKAIAIESENLEYLFSKCTILDDLGKFKESVECYENVIEIDNDYLNAWNNLSIIYGDNFNDYTNAIRCLDEVLKRDLEFPESLYLKSIYIRKKANEEARKLEKKLISLKYHKIFLEEQLEYNLIQDLKLLKKFGYDLKFLHNQLYLTDRNGRIDILCRNRKDNGLLVIELKNVKADIKAFNQISDYIESMKITRNKNVKGLVISRDYDKKFKKLLDKSSEISQLNLEDLGFE